MKKTRFLRIFNFVPVLLFCVLLFTACDTPSQKRRNAENEARGQKNAVAYIEQKYGFTPNVVSAEVDRIPGGYGGTATSNVLVKMEYGGKNFVVLIYGASETTDGSDSYQTEEIIEALKKAIDDNLPGLVRFSVSSAGQVESDPKAVVFSQKYVGSNLKEVLAEGISGFDAGYVNLDLDDRDRFSFVENYVSTAQKEVRFVSLRVPGYEKDKYKDDVSFCLQRSVLSNGYIDLSTGKCVKYDYRSYNDEMFYCAMPDENGKTAALTVTEGDYGELRDFAHTKTEVITPLTKAYTITADAWVQTVEIYYPLPEEALTYEARRNKCIVRRMEYADGTVKTDRMFSVSDTGGMLRVAITVPDNCKVTFGVLDIVETEKNE